MVSVLPPPPIRGVGRSGGFKFMVEDRKDADVKALARPADAIEDWWPKGKRQAARSAASGPAPPLLVGLFSVFRANAPQLYVDLNRPQCMTMDVPLADAFNTLQIYLGSLYVNDFNRFGRTWQVVVQADAKFRNRWNDVQATEGPQPAGGDGAHRRHGRRARGERPVDPHPLQHVPGRRHQRQRRARASVPARPST